MIKLKLIHGLSHDNGYVRATAKEPYVEVETEEIAAFCTGSGFFERVAEGPAKETPSRPEPAEAEPDAKGSKAQTTSNAALGASPAVGDELGTMTVTELRSYAATVGIDLGKLNKRADIIAAIRKAEAEG